MPPVLLPFKGHGVPYPILTAATGLFLYALGAALAYVSGIDFVRHSWYIILFIAGFVWVANVLCWAFDNYEPILRSLEPSLEMSREDFRRLIEDHLNDVYSDRFALYLQVLLLPIGVVYILLSAAGYVWVPEIVRQEILIKPLMLAYFLLITVLLGIIGLYGAAKIIQYMAFINRLSRIPLRLSILRVRTKTDLNNLGRFSLLSSLTWNVGLTMVTPIFFSVVNPFTLSVFVVALVIGVSFFVMPQFQLHGTIVEAKGKLSEELTATALALQSDEYVKAWSLTVFSDHIESIKDWSFDVTTVLKQVGSVAIPIVAYLIQLLPKLAVK